MRSTLLPALLLLATATCATSVQRLSDGSIVQYGEKDGAPYLAQWTDGAWVPITVTVGMAPAKGEFDAVCADAQGDLFVLCTDASNPDKKTSGLLARVGGAWSRLGALEKSWTVGSKLAAISPTAVFINVKLGKERKPAVGHWDGKGWSAVPLPASMEEIDDLAVHGGAVVVQANGRGPSGTYRDGKNAYRLVGGVLEQMGASAGGGIEQLLVADDGTLLRLGRVAEKWEDNAWTEAFTFENSSLDGYRIVRACAGPKDALYAVLTDQDHKDHLARATTGGGFAWFKGTAEAAKFEYGLYDLFCDATGALHLTMAGDPMDIDMAGFGFAKDGYPEKDEMVHVVNLANKAIMLEYNRLSRELVKFDSTAQATKSAADISAYRDKAQGAMVWSTKNIEQLKALQVGRGRNRLHDALLDFLQIFHDYLFLDYKLVESLPSNDFDKDMDKEWHRSNIALQIAYNKLKEENASYAARNGLK